MKQINVSIDTKKKLSELKRDGDTFNDVITRLLDLEDKYNPIDIVFEYEYQLFEGTRLFRVIFSDKVKIQYYSMKTHKFKNDIAAWNDVEKVPQQEMEDFIRFIVKESNLYVLYEMDKELVQNNIWIRRV